MSGIACAATAVLIAYIADGTRTIRAGRVESCCSTMRRSSWLSSLERSRHATLGASTSGWRALRKLTYSRPVRCDGPWKPTLLHLRMNFDIIPKMWKGGRAVRAIPGAGLQVPLSILGSSLFGAAVSAMLGLPFAFASR